MPENIKRISTADLRKKADELSKQKREELIRKQELERQKREEAAQQNKIPNYKGGSLWQQYKAALESGEAKNANEFITKRDERNEAWNKIGADTLNDDMKALSNSIGAAYGDTLDTSKYYTQEQLNASSNQVKQILDRLKALQDYYNTYGGSDDQKKAVGEQIKAYDSEIKFFGDLANHYGSYKNEADFNYRTDKRLDEDYIVNEYDTEAGKKNLEKIESSLSELEDAYRTLDKENYALSLEKAFQRGETTVEIPKNKMTEFLRQYMSDDQKDKSNYVKIDLVKFMNDYNSKKNGMIQEYQLESFALNNADRMRTAAAYKKLAENQDFLQGVISGKAVENPTFEDYLNYENEMLRLAEKVNSGIATREEQRKYAELSENAPTVKNRFRFLEDAQSGKYGGQGYEQNSTYSGLDKALLNSKQYHYEQMTDDEKRVYYYLLGTQGAEAADRYLDDLKTTLDYRNTEEVKQYIRDLKNSKIFGNVSAAALANTFGGLGGAALGYLIADSNEGVNKTAGDIAYSAASVPLNVFGGAISTVGEIGQRLDLASKGDWEGKGYNPYENYNLFSVAGREARGLVAKDIEDSIGWEMFGQNVMSQVYQSLMSGVDSSFGMATLGKLYTVSMGGSAAASKAAELYESGASSSQIYWESLLSGIAEATFEYLSIENLSSIKSIVESKPTTLKKAIKMILTQNGIEASEEVFTEISNMVIDKGIKKYDSDYDRKVTEYVRDGMTREEAVKKAAGEVAADIGWAGAGGFISGLASSSLTIAGAYRAGKENADAQISAIDPGNAEGLYNNAKNIDYSILNDASEALKKGDAKAADEIISEGKDWYEYLKSYAKEKYGKNQASEISANIDSSIDNLNQIKNLISSGNINADSIQAVLEKAKSAQDTKVDVTSANDEKLFSLLAKGEPSNSVIEKNILKDRGTLAAFERLTGLRIGGTTVSQKRADVREAFKAVSSSSETLKAAQNAIESGATATEGHKNAAVIIDQAMQANRAENSRLRNSEKVKSAETKAAIDATNRQHRFLETVRNYVINGGDLSGFTESPVANVSGEGGTNSSETKTTQETAKKRVKADFSAYQDERYSAEDASALANLNSKEEQDAFFRNENARIEQEIKNIESSDSITAEEKAQRIGELKEAASRNYSLAKAMDDFREMGRLVRAGEVDKVIDSLRKPLKKMGINIEVVDNIEAAEGMRSGAYFDKRTNTIKVSRDWNGVENVVKLELAADGNGFVLNPGKIVSFDRAVTQTIAHEIAHADPGLTLDFIKAVAGTQYDAFDLKGRLEHPDDRSWRSEDAQKEKNWRRYVDAYTEQAMLEMKGTEEQRRASAEKVVNDAYIFEDIMADMFGAAVDDMGHSGKAGENIFWAMNRNKPGIIKRILNALERFIARIRGKDAYLAVEQRQAAERLRNMLTGELKRAYGTEVKGEAAVESDEGKRYSITSDGKVSETASDDTSSIKEQLRNSLDTVNALESVASVEYSPTNKKELKDRAISEFRKIGFVVDRQNFGKIEIGEKQITNSLNYLNTEAEKAALLTVPKVLKRGEIISGHKDHKGRAYSTITIAAPVEINGVRGNVAATVRQTGASRYYTHRILLPNGSEFIFAESRKNEEPTFVGMPAANDSQRSTISSSSVNSISQADGNVNRKFSENSDVQTIEDGGTVENDSGEFVAESDGNGGTRWSLSTYESSGRETLRQYLDGQVSESGLTEADAKAVLDSMDDIYEICRKYEGEYVPFGAWSRAEVVIDEKGNPVFSVIKPNGEYAMNLDFSLVCKKRRALDAVLNRLIETGAINDFGFGQEEIVRVNEIIREHGFEIACDMCFVDAKRYRQAGVADQFVDLYNSIVKSMAKDGQEIDYFNFANDSSLSHTEGGIDRLSDAELDFSEINEITKPGAKKTVEYRIAQYLKTHPSDRKLLSRGDFMSTVGFDAVKVSKPDILKLYNSKKGTGGPKAAQSDVQYLNDILSSKKFNRSAAYDVGGVRVQSFSDYVPRLVFDYVQMIGDLAAKRLPAHAYTKEPLFAKQFGLTGMKINMSLMPAKGNGKYAGLNADGSYAWARESFPAEEAFRIQADPEYGKNVGTIAVGISDEHIWKMLSDPYIRMVIPYHKSGINPAVAVKLKIGEYTDYTGQQNTRRRDGKQLTKAELKNIPDINRLMHRDGLDAVEASRRYVEWCEDNGYIPKFEKFAYMTDSDGNRVFNENYYKLLEDFTTMVDGEFHPQGDVTATFPGSDSAFGSMADLIKEGLEEDAVTANRLNAEVDGLAEEVRSALGRDERHSLVKSAQSELKALQKENEKLRQDVDDLKQELQLTHGRKLSRDALISSIQKILIDGYGVKLSAKELYPHVTNLYDMFYNNTVDGKRLKKDERVDTMRIIEEMDKIVDAVIENAVGVDDTYVEMKKLLPELRNTKLVVPMDARADAAQSAGFENWAEFRKANFGRVGFANEGLPVDTYYMELSERYPELFPDGITHPGEQAAHIADVVNTIRESGINEYQLYDIEDERIRTSIKNDVMDIIGNAEKLQTFADRAAQKVEDTKLAEAMHYGADIAKLKRLNAEKVADIKAENRKRLSDMRRKYQDRVESVRERYAEARANRSEKQKQTVLRNKVLRKYTEASTMLDRPTTENHFTEAMRKPIMEFLAAVDITTGKSVAKQGVYDRILRIIEAANNMAAEDGKNGLDIAETDLNVQEKQLIVDSGLLERMAAWVEANQGKKLTELSSAQLEELNGIFNQLKHLTAEIKRLYDPREGLAAKSWQAQKEIGLAQMKERKQVLGAKTEKAREKYEQIHFGALDAAGYYNTLGSDTMTAQFERFRQCQNRFSENIQMFTDRLGEIVDGAIPKDEHGKNAKEVTLKLSHGTLTATPAQLMSVYLMLNQEDSRRCLFNEAGGVIIGKFTAEKPKDGKAHIAGKRTFAQSGRLVLNEADAAKITAALTDGQRKRADAISALLNNEAARLGNEVSMAMYGYKKYTTENYFPMRTADDYRAIADNPNYEMNLLGLSFTKERTGRAGKALVAEDIYDVIGRHLTNMAQYNAFAQELDNAKKMYSLRLGDGTSLKQRIIRSYGREADTFYNKLINNLSGVQMYTNNSAEALSDKLLSNYKAAAVAGNVSVVLKQPMSIFRALPEFSLAGLKKSMALEDILNLSPKQLKANTAEMLKYSGIARLKAWGSSENMTRKSFESLYNDNSDTARQKINEFLTSGAENADMWTWAKLWRMSKAEIDAQGKYTAGSKEYFEAVDKKFSDVIGKTQVVQSALDSSMAVQNAKGFGKFLFAFQNEPLKQYSYLISTLNDARRGKPGAKKKLAKVIASSLANTAAVSAISTFMAWLRGTLDRDDDDELLDDLMKEFAGNSIDDLLSGAFAPVWQYIDTIMGAINSGVYGNTVERLDMAALTDLGGLINKYFISQNGGRPNLGTVQDIVNVASNLFGLPAKNIFRDVKSVIDRIILELPVPSAAKYNYLKAWKDVELTNKAAVTEAYYDVLRDAVDRGRYSDYVKIKRDMIYHGYTETKIKNAVMKSSLMDDLYELKKVNPGSYKAKVNSIVSSVSAVSSLEGKEFEDFIESAMKRREREDGGSKTDDEVYDEMHRKMEKEVKEQLIYIDVSKRAAYIKKMLKTYGEYGITEADILKVLRKAGKA